MSLWEDIKAKVREKITDFGIYFQDFKQRHPIFKAVFGFLTHETMLRLYAVVGGLAAAPLTGGISFLVVATACATFVTSLISIIAKGIQIRNLEKVKLEKGLTEAIAERHKAMEKLKAEPEKKRDRLFGILQRPSLQEEQTMVGLLDRVKNEFNALKGELNAFVTHKIPADIPGKFKSFLRALRDVGTENLLSGALMASATGPVGLAVYAVSLVLGMFYISKEFADRTKIEEDKAEMKKAINQACIDGEISTYKNLKALNQIFAGKMTEYEATKRMCEIYDENPNMPDEDIRATYQLIKDEVQDRVEFQSIPPEPDFWRTTWREVRPWGKKYVEEYHIPVDQVIKYKEPPEHSKPSPIVIDKPLPSTSQQRTGPTKESGHQVL